METASPRRRRSRPRLLVERLERRELLAGAGTLDPSFGAGRGFVIRQVGPASSTEMISDKVNGVFTRPDGKVVVAVVESVSIGPPYTIISQSRSTSDFLLERFNADGSPDVTFGQGGEVTVPVPFSTTSSLLRPGGSIGQAVVMQADGKILAAGTIVGTTANLLYTTSAYAVIRVNVDGTLDTTYGDGGLATYPPGVQSPVRPGLTGVTAAALQPDGRLVLVGGSAFADFAAVRLNADGSLDTSFGAGGTREVKPGPSAEQVAIQPDGGIIVAGTAQAPGSLANPVPAYGVARLNPDGSVDTTFGGPSATGGLVTLPTDPTNPAPILSIGVPGLAVQPDNRIVLTTDEVSSIGAVPFADELHRLNADGTLDASFGQAGLVRPAVAGPVAIQADGRIVVGGNDVTLLGADGLPVRTVFAAARFHPDGSADASFGNTATPGLARSSFGASGLGALTIQPDGNIILAGSTSSTSPSFGSTSPAEFEVARVLGQATTGPDALPPPATPPASFDGSGRTNLAVYLPAIGAFASRPYTGSSPGSYDQIIRFGIPGAGQTLPAAADYAGVGSTQIAAYLPSFGDYAIRPAGGGPDQVFPFGIPGAGQSIPAPADYEGTGLVDVAVYMPSLGAFGIRPSRGGPDRIVGFGIPGAGQSIPVPADYTGDGKADLAVYLPTLGAFAIRPSQGGPDRLIAFGIKGVGKSIPAPGDYDNSGRTELAVYLPSLAVLAYRPAKGGADVYLQIGRPNSGEIPTPGDYSGSGHTEVAIYDPTLGAFAYRPAGGGPDVITAFGSRGKGQSIPIAAAPTATAAPATSKPKAVKASASAVGAGLTTIRPAAVPGGPLASRRAARTSVLQARPEASASAT